MRATIKMIAEKAGVSIGTVDRVLHDRPYVKAEVRDRVLQVMEELDYHPNRVASALATSGTARRFAVVQPAWESYIREDMARGVERFCTERQDYNVAVDVWPYPDDDTAACLKQLDRAAEEQVDGVALCATDNATVRQKLEQLASAHIPVVTFNSDIPAGSRLCYVGEDAHRAGRVAGEITSKFLTPEQSLLLVYAGPDYAGHEERAKGFVERLEEKGFTRARCRIAVTHNQYEPTLQAVTEALEQDPELRLIYMANESVSACVEAIRRCGREGMVHVLSHDCGPETRQFLLDGRVDFTIDQDFAYQSYQALTVLFRNQVEHWQPDRQQYASASPILNAEVL